MRDDLHKTAKCPSAWQELFRISLNTADRAKPDRAIDAAVKALTRDLNVELTGPTKSLLRRLTHQPSFLDAHELIAGYEARTPLEVALISELRACTGPQGFEATLSRALAHQSESYLREFDCRMVEGRVYDRADVERALRAALGDTRVTDVCEAFLKQQKIEAKAEGLHLDEVLSEAPTHNNTKGSGP